MLSFSLAKDQVSYKAVQQYVHAVYTGEGYVSQDERYDDGIRAVIGKKGTYTITAHAQENILGTISLIHADSRVLPMESLYAHEMHSLITQRSLCAEISQFAVKDMSQLKRDDAYSKFDITVGLLAHVIAVAQKKGVHHCFFTINPKHRSFYESIGCIQIGGEKEYGLVGGAPALAYALDISRLHDLPKKNFILQKIEHTKIPASFFNGY